MNEIKLEVVDNVIILDCDPKEVLILDLSNKMLNSIPKNISSFENIIELDLSENNISSFTIDLEKLKSLSVLKVNYNPISEVPECIGNFTNISQLDIRGTNIEKLPDCMKNLSKLTRLDISFNNFENLPNCIEKLSNLITLDISNNNIEKLPDWIENLTNLTTLDMSYNNIEMLPDCMKNLKNITSLNISSNNFKTLPDWISNLPEINELSIGENYLGNLPCWISSLNKLRQLDISANNLEKLPDGLENLSNLSFLNISYNHISELPDWMKNLNNLSKLEIKRNNLDELPDWIGNFVNLNWLDISSNNISRLPDWIGNLINLNYLDISDNDFEEIPECIKNLINLTELQCNSNKLTKLPNGIGNLKELTLLDIAHNFIEDLPESIGNLDKLNNLLAYNNCLSRLPQGIANLKELQGLFIYSNKFTSFPIEIENLKKLYHLDISSTDIKVLPDWLGNLEELGILNISCNTIVELPYNVIKNFKCFELDNSNVGGLILPGTIIMRNVLLSTQPISLFSQNNNLIQAYYREKKEFVSESKVIFLGNGEVGKTYTVQRLLNKDKLLNYDTKTTQGINVSSIDYDGYKINFWDFGGQEIMHAMHRCFLTDRSCYVIIISNRLNTTGIQPGMDQARYWLKSISSFAPNSPIILAVNKWNNTKNNDINKTQLFEEFPNIVDIIEYVANLDDEISQFEFIRLKNLIITTARSLDSSKLQLPSKWMNVRNEIKGLSSSNPYISKEKYLELCVKNEIDLTISEWLLNWLNDLGDCFSYHGNQPNYSKIEDYKLLSPKWFVNAAYKIINCDKDYYQNGVILIRNIKNILKDIQKNTEGNSTEIEVPYNSNDVDYIIDVLCKFNLAYRLKDERNLFMPMLCDSDSPKAPIPIDFKEHIAFGYRYSFLTDSVIYHLMVSCMEEFQTLDTRWRTGFILQDRFSNCTAILDMSKGDHILYVDVYSIGFYSPKALFFKLKEIIRQINNKLNLSPEEVLFVNTGTKLVPLELGFVISLLEQGYQKYPIPNGQMMYQVDLVRQLGNIYDTNVLDNLPSIISKEQNKVAVLDQKMIQKNGPVYNGPVYNGPVYIQNGISPEVVETFIQDILNSTNQNQQVLIELANSLKQSNDQEIKGIATSIEDGDKKKGLKKLLNFLNEGGKQADNFKKVYDCVSTYGPLVAAILNFVPQF